MDIASEKQTEQLWKMLSNDLYRFIRSRVADEDDTRDILQEVFVKIHTKIGQLQSREKIHGWVFRIARNQIVDHFRGKKVPDREELLLSLEEDPGSNEYEASIGHTLREMVTEMPVEECDAFCMYELDGVPQLEIAKTLNLSYSATKTRIHRTRKLIRDRLMECCHFDFDRYGRVVSYHPKECCCCCTD
jgi:RNA polymerase sigma-70 factor, ECF subfamily